MNNLIKKTEALIEYEKSTNPDIQHINVSHAPLIAQIVSNYNLKPVPPGVKPRAKMIFLGAPTGSGKDTLVRKLTSNNPEDNFVVLNMDMFRHYHREITGSNDYISDKDYAIATNQTSYELYYLIQELILREFPGTSTIITGTMRDLDWIEEIAKRYKFDPKTDYDLSLVTLAVPTRESALSIFERYLRLVDERDLSSTIPLRYTGLEYHNDTVKKFSTNVRLIEDNFHQDPNNRYFNSIRVYRRNKDIFDLSEDTLIYDSNHPDPNKCAYAHIFTIMSSQPTISKERISSILDVIKRNSEYLKKQGLYESIIKDIESIVVKHDKNLTDVAK
ncbi:MAG: zeta toxin family protein [Clostridia bacterium]|nr:zeta toxin family protein [Clostridia bacterium]